MSESKQEQLSLLDIGAELVVKSVPSSIHVIERNDRPTETCSATGPTNSSMSRRQRGRRRICCPNCGGELAGELVDNAAIRRWLGVTEAAAEAMMRRVPKVNVPDLRKVYVRRRELERLIDENTRFA